MRHVLYGILRSEADAAGRVADLAAGPQLRLISNGELGAAVSLTAGAAAGPPDAQGPRADRAGAARRLRRAADAPRDFIRYRGGSARYPP